MRIKLRNATPHVGVMLAAILVMTVVGLQVVHGQAQHVRWDIVNRASTTPPTISEGGVAFAIARNPSSLTIALRGSGTFVAPASGGESSAVKGGGSWETFSGGVSTGKGTYTVTRLASWQFSGLQTPGANNDLIGPNAANGNAVFRIQYSDGSQGILGVGCHGPGAPNGIVEGVIASKDDVTYWDAGAPLPAVNLNRTSFHIQ